MSKTLASLLTGLFFGNGSGFLLGESSGAELHGADHGGADTVHDDSARDVGSGGHAGMSHDTLSENGPRYRDLHIGVPGVTSAPQGVNAPHVPGRGHAHIHVNGVRIARTCSLRFHPSALQTRAKGIPASLSASDRGLLATGGVPAETKTRLTIG